MRCYHIRLQPVKSCLLLLHAYLRRVGLLRVDGTSRSRASALSPVTEEDRHGRTGTIYYTALSMLLSVEASPMAVAPGSAWAWRLLRALGCPQAGSVSGGQAAGGDLLDLLTPESR